MLFNGGCEYVQVSGASRGLFYFYFFQIWSSESLKFSFMLDQSHLRIFQNFMWALSRLYHLTNVPHLTVDVLQLKSEEAEREQMSISILRNEKLPTVWNRTIKPSCQRLWRTVVLLYSEVPPLTKIITFTSYLPALWACQHLQGGK